MKSVIMTIMRSDYHFPSILATPDLHPRWTAHASLSPAAGALRTLALVGHPNVGKSVLFHRLTGTYVTVSNYPGTTVEVSRAAPRFDREASLLDTPGVLALPSRSDDERATMRALLNEDMRTLIQVGDAKNLRRTLNLTALLAELGVPMVMALNMTDEAKARGVTVDAAALAEALGVPVVATVATGGEGVAALTDALPQRGRAGAAAALRPGARARHRARRAAHPRHTARIRAWPRAGWPSSPSAVTPRSRPGWQRSPAASRCGRRWPNSPPPSVATRCRPASRANAAAPPRPSRAPSPSKPAARTARCRCCSAASRCTACGAGRCCSACSMRSISFVGDFGASTLVGLLEEDFFGEVLNPAVTAFVRSHISTPWLADLFVGEYGLWTMGMTYALALILPIVTTFFLAFGVLEDSGYFSRLSVIANRMFAAIGLNGRAVLPMVLGLGCVTMATLDHPHPAHPARAPRSPST